MDALLRPRGIAVVGASERSAMAARLTDYLADFDGGAYPVNPNHDRIHGLPCYPSLDQLPGPVDLVLVLVPAPRVRDVLAQAGRAGASAAIVLSSGFAETGATGRQLQDELVAVAREHGLRLIGPNCQGLIYRPAGLAATFTAAAAGTPAADSGIAYVGQSGALGGSFLGMARDRGIGLTAWISVGNQADLTATDAAELLLEDPHVRVLACYLEELPPGSSWHRLTARAAELGKQVVVLRSGRSDTGQRAVASHTGALVRDGAAFDLLTRDSGAVQVDDLDEMLDASTALATGPAAHGGRIGVVTSSGGAGGLAADQADRAGLVLPELDPATREQLAALIPDFGSAANPVDVTAQVINDAGQLGEVCAAVGDAADVDAVLVLLTTLGGPEAERIAESIRAAAARSPKPHAVAWMYAQDEIAEPSALLRRAGIPVLASTGSALRLLARLRRPEITAAPEPEAARGLHRLLPAGRAELTEADGAPLLDALDVPRPRARLIAEPEQAAAAAAELGERVVLKVQSRDLGHKSEAGGVRVGVPATEAVPQAREMLAAVGDSAPRARVDGVLVQELVGGGVELLVGVRGARGGYPPVVTAGTGGTATELHGDVVSALAPLTGTGAAALLRRLRSWPLLAGFRGSPPVDVAVAASAIAALSAAAVELGEDLDELEVNPLVVSATGAVAADLVLRLRRDPAPEADEPGAERAAELRTAT